MLAKRAIHIHVHLNTTYEKKKQCLNYSNFINEEILKSLEVTYSEQQTMNFKVIVGTLGLSRLKKKSCDTS